MNYLIDPSDITNFNRTESELQLFWLFCCVVAGKTAKTQAKLLNNFLLSLPEAEKPFDRICAIGYNSQKFYDSLQASRLGQYNRLAKCFRESIQMFNCGGLASATIEDLEGIFGVGPKTARFFILHSRPDQKIAVLDTHILKYLRANGVDAPKTTPGSGALYNALELKFIKLAEDQKVPVADLDLQIWNMYSK